MPTPCPGCNKFPSVEPDEIEVEDLEINEDGVVTGSAHLVLKSECCGEEMKEYTFEMEHQVEIPRTAWHTFEQDPNEIEGTCKHCGTPSCQHDGDDRACMTALDSLEVDATASVDDCKVKGKKAYKITVDITITDKALKEPVTASVDDTVLSADMEEMC